MLVAKRSKADCFGAAWQRREVHGGVSCTAVPVVIEAVSGQAPDADLALNK